MANMMMVMLFACLPYTRGAGLADVLFGLQCGNIVGSGQLVRCRWMLGTLGPGVLERFAGLLVNGDYYSTISGGVASH